jgi:TonB family protein
MPSAAIDKGLIRTVVRSHVREIRGCYEQGLATDPKLAGRVVVRFTIDPRGTVSEAAVASSDLPPQAQLVQACIVAAVKNWRFPVPPQSTKAEVLYPFVLAPGRTVASPSGLIEGDQVDGRWFPVEGQPADTAIVEVLDSQHRPVPSVKVILAIAIGAASEEREAITDAAGLATFERLPSAATAMAMVEPGARTESTVVGSGAVGAILVIEVVGQPRMDDDDR